LECLRELGEIFEIIVFTASHSSYANAVLDYLDPSGDLIAHRLYREHCYQAGEMHIKDLRIIDRPLRDMLLVDNAAHSFCFQPSNGIPCVSFYEDSSDQELKRLIPYAKALANSRDMLGMNKAYFQLHQHLVEPSFMGVLKKIFG
jgi:CTD small phosphatase-like protein 2